MTVWGRFLSRCGHKFLFLSHYKWESCVAANASDFLLPHVINVFSCAAQEKCVTH